MQCCIVSIPDISTVLRAGNESPVGHERDTHLVTLAAKADVHTSFHPFRLERGENHHRAASNERPSAALRVGHNPYYPVVWQKKAMLVQRAVQARERNLSYGGSLWLKDQQLRARRNHNARCTNESHADNSLLWTAPALWHQPHVMSQRRTT